MSTDMKTQIRGYVSQMEEDQAPIDSAEVLALLEPVREVPPPPAPATLVRPRVKRHRNLRWVYGMAAAVVALLLVGGVAWLSRSDPLEEPADVVTTIPTEDATEPSLPESSRSDPPDIPPTTPRRCLPDEVALSIETDDQSDGALAITTKLENTGAALCEVVLDEVYAAITDGAGHLVDIDGNPISTSAGSAALFPGDTLQIAFDWRNSCGDYAAVAFQVDVTNVGSAEVGIPYPKCDPGTDGTFELFPDSNIVESQTDGGQPDGTCRFTIIERVSYPYPTALEALAAELDAIATGSAFDEFVELSGLTTEDFLATLNTDNEVTFRLLADTVDQVTMRARRAGEGWGVNTVISCTK